MKTVSGMLKTDDFEEAFELTFDDAEINALTLYADDMGRCLQRSFLRSSDNFHISIKFNSLDTSQPNASVETGEFDEEQWSAFLHVFRPLADLNNKEMYGFLRIRNLIGRRAQTSSHLTGFLRHLLDEFQIKKIPSEMKFGINGKEYDLEAVFSLWMNAMEFHRDAEKRVILDKMSGLLPADGIRTLMANVALEKLWAMAGLRHIIVLMLAPGGAKAPLSLRPPQ